MVPDGDKNDGNEKDDCGDGVDFWSDAAAEAAPNFKRQRIFAAVEKKGDGDFVHRERENQESGAEVERSFFLAAIHFLQAGKKFRGGDGDERCAVAEKNSDEAEVQANAYSKEE